MAATARSQSQLVGFDPRLSAAGVSVAVGVGKSIWVAIGEGLGDSVGLG